LPFRALSDSVPNKILLLAKSQSIWPPANFGLVTLLIVYCPPQHHVIKLFLINMDVTKGHMSYAQAPTNKRNCWAIMQGKVGYSRHFFAFSTTDTLFQVQTSSKFVTQ